MTKRGFFEPLFYVWKNYPICSIVNLFWGNRPKPLN